MKPVEWAFDLGYDGEPEPDLAAMQGLLDRAYECGRQCRMTGMAPAKWAFDLGWRDVPEPEAVANHRDLHDVYQRAQKLGCREREWEAEQQAHLVRVLEN